MPCLLVAEGFRELSTARYRSWNRRDQMVHGGLGVLMWVGWNPALWGGTKDSIGIVQRLPYTPENADYFERLKKECAQVGYDIDDLLFDHHRLPNNTGMSLELCQQYARALSWADFLTCSTPELATELRARWPDKPVHVFPNVTGRLLTHTALQGRLQPRNFERVTIGYTSASLAHQDDFNMVIPVLDSILKEHPHVDVAIVGSLNQNMDFVNNWHGRVKCWPFVTYDALPALIHSIIDINIVPLLDIPFNRCKSLVKWLEAAVVGVPTVCSQLGRYKNLPSGTAYSAKDSNEWHFFLTRLIENPALRESMGGEARRHALDKFSYTNTESLDFLKAL